MKVYAVEKRGYDGYWGEMILSQRIFVSLKRASSALKEMEEEGSPGLYLVGPVEIEVEVEE